jgi:hypothetical protein
MFNALAQFVGAARCHHRHLHCLICSATSLGSLNVKHAMRPTLPVAVTLRKCLRCWHINTDSHRSLTRTTDSAGSSRPLAAQHGATVGAAEHAVLAACAAERDDATRHKAEQRHQERGHPVAQAHLPPRDHCASVSTVRAAHNCALRLACGLLCVGRRVLACVLGRVLTHALVGYGWWRVGVGVMHGRVPRAGCSARVPTVARVRLPAARWVARRLTVAGRLLQQRARNAESQCAGS